MKNLSSILISTLLLTTVLSIKQDQKPLPSATIVKCLPPPPEPSVHVEVHHEAHHSINGKGQNHVHRVVNGEVKKSESNDVNGGYADAHKVKGRMFKKKFFKRAKADADRVMNNNGFGNGNAPVNSGSSGSDSSANPPVCEKPANPPVIFDIIGYKRKDLDDYAKSQNVQGKITVEGDKMTISGLCNTCSFTKTGNLMMCTRKLCIPELGAFDSYVANILEVDNFSLLLKKALQFNVEAEGEWITVKRQ